MTNAHGNRHVVVTSIERAPLDTVDALAGARRRSVAGIAARVTLATG